MWKYTWLLLLLGLWACNTRGGPSGNGGEPEVSMAIYSVPAGMQESIRDILNNNFRALSGKDKGHVARLDVLPNGQLVLFGPPHIHNGMAKLIAGLKSTDPPPARNSSLSFWMVLARSAENRSAAPELDELGQVLQTIDPKGSMSFHLLEKMRVTAASGTRSEAYGTFFALNYGLHKSAGRAVADLDIPSY